MRLKNAEQVDNERYNNFLFVRSECIGKDIKWDKLKAIFISYGIPMNGYYLSTLVNKGFLIKKSNGFYSFGIEDITIDKFKDAMKEARRLNTENASKCRKLAKDENDKFLNNLRKKNNTESLIAVGTKEDKNLTNFKEKINNDKEKEAIKFLLSTGKYKVLKLEQVEVITYRDEWKECTIE